MACIRAYVKAGGKIYDSKFTSLTTKDGNRLDNFMVSEVFGTSYEGETAESFTNIAKFTHPSTNWYGFGRTAGALDYTRNERVADNNDYFEKQLAPNANIPIPVHPLAPAVF